MLLPRLCGTGTDGGAVMPGTGEVPLPGSDISLLLSEWGGSVGVGKPRISACAAVESIAKQNADCLIFVVSHAVSCNMAPEYVINKQRGTGAHINIYPAFMGT